MAHKYEREQPTLGRTALQIVEDIPTVLVAGRTTLHLNRTFQAQVEDISLRLQWNLRQPFPSSPGKTQDIKLPSDTPRIDSPSHCGSSLDTNTTIQEILARVTGVLKQEESWSDFLNRDNIAATANWREFDRVGREEPDKIPGMQYTLPIKLEQVVQYAGKPYYLLVGTNYPDVRAIVQFKPLGRSQTPLDRLVEEGRTTMHITLRVPTQEFLAA